MIVVIGESSKRKSEEQQHSATSAVSFDHCVDHAAERDEASSWKPDETSTATNYRPDVWSVMDEVSGCLQHALGTFSRSDLRLSHSNATPCWLISASDCFTSTRMYFYSKYKSVEVNRLPFCFLNQHFSYVPMALIYVAN